MTIEEGKRHIEAMLGKSARAQGVELRMPPLWFTDTGEEIPSYYKLTVRGINGEEYDKRLSPEHVQHCDSDHQMKQQVATMIESLVIKIKMHGL